MVFTTLEALDIYPQCSCVNPLELRLFSWFHLLIIVVLHVYELLPVYEFFTIESSCVDVFYTRVYM